MCQRGIDASRVRGGRGQSETLGLVLVFGLVILGASAVVVLGASALGDSRETLSTQRAEKALTQLDSKAALVALDNTDVQSVSFASREAGRFRVVNGTGSLNMTIVNSSSGAKTMLLNQSLGAVTYTNGGSELAYQGGGVWRSTGNGSVMVSPPEFHFRNGTLTLPVINVTGEPSISRGAAIQHTETIDTYPIQADDDRQNPLDEHRIFVVVRSEYYQAWGRYFEERTDGNVVYDHDRNVARLELVSPLGKQTLNAATASRAASGTFDLQGNAKMACGSKTTVYTDSYNSSESGTYCTQSQANQGHVVYGETVDIDVGTGSSNLRGNVVSGGEVFVSGSSGSGQPDVYGHINHTDGCNPAAECPNRIIAGSGGSVNEISGVATMHNINLLIETKVDDIQTDSDSAPDYDAATDSLDFSGGAAQLPAGQYYLENVVINSGEALVLDTSSGDVTLAIEGGLKLEDSASVQVVGGGVAKVYMEGDDSIHARSTDVVLKKDTSIQPVSAGYLDNATKFRLYGPDDLTVEVGEGSGVSNLARYVGVIFAPPGRSGTARVDIYGGEVFGGILTGTTTLDKGSIHYDEALANTQVISRDEKTVRVTFLHVTVNRVRISNG